MKFDSNVIDAVRSSKLAEQEERLADLGSRLADSEQALDRVTTDSVAEIAAIREEASGRIAELEARIEELEAGQDSFSTMHERVRDEYDVAADVAGKRIAELEARLAVRA